MIVNGKGYRTVWMEGCSVFLIDQNKLPFSFEIRECPTFRDSCSAIKDMTVRGAGAIGAAAAYAMAQAFLEAPEEDFENYILLARREIESTRPTARELFYAVEKVYMAGIAGSNPIPAIPAAPQAPPAIRAIHQAHSLVSDNIDQAQRIGLHGAGLIPDVARILTHCNAGWLGFVDYGSALAPVYLTHQQGKNIFVYVDETRPRGQGARLTAWELQNEGVPFAVIADNAAAHYMSKGLVDLVIVGADRIAVNGDTANKIGTLEKAILAKHYGIPFYVAAPISTFDKDCPNGEHIIIEERDEEEVLCQSGPDEEGNIRRIRVATPGAHALNPAFDVTPGSLITGFITDTGILKF